MNRAISFLAALIFVLSKSTVIFADNNIQKNSESDVLTTVSLSENDVPEEEISEFPKVYPVNVYESSNNDIKQIIKTYELSEDEKQEDIPRNSFQRNGWTYELTDIIKKETSSADVKEHTKTVSLNTDTNDTNAIVKQLAPTVEYKSNDGYMGILTLDVQSIKVETAGTKNENYTVSSVREYPNLSSNDTASIPKTITENGKTMTISGIEWRTHTSSSVDHQELPTTYTAIVNYTATGSNTVVTGYLVTAAYKGSISKIKAGKTIYTAIFNGKKTLLEKETESVSTQEVTQLSGNTTTGKAIKLEDMKGGDNKEKTNVFNIFIALFFILGGIVSFNILWKRSKNNEESENKSSQKLEDDTKGELKE